MWMVSNTSFCVNCSHILINAQISFRLRGLLVQDGNTNQSMQVVRQKLFYPRQAFLLPNCSLVHNFVLQTALVSPFWCLIDIIFIINYILNESFQRFWNNAEIWGKLIMKIIFVSDLIDLLIIKRVYKFAI